MVCEWWALAATSRSVSYRCGARQARARSSMNVGLAAALHIEVLEPLTGTVLKDDPRMTHGNGTAHSLPETPSNMGGALLSGVVALFVYGRNDSTTL